MPKKLTSLTLVSNANQVNRISKISQESMVERINLVNKAAWVQSPTLYAPVVISKATHVNIVEHASTVTYADTWRKVVETKKNDSKKEC